MDFRLLLGRGSGVTSRFGGDGGDDVGDTGGDPAGWGVMACRDSVRSLRLLAPRFGVIETCFSGSGISM